jgi:hypothetical protein
MIKNLKLKKKAAIKIQLIIIIKFLIYYNALSTTTVSTLIN